MNNFNRGRGGRRDSGFNGGRRDSRRGAGGFGGGRRDGGRPDMHSAVCDECNQDCEVPFRPTGNKPIFCSRCFEKQGGGNKPNRFGGGRDRKPSFNDSKPNQDNKEILKGIKTLNYKLDELIKALNQETPAEKTPDTVKNVATKKKAAPKKKTVKKVVKKVVKKKVTKKKAAPKKKVVKKVAKKKVKK